MIFVIIIIRPAKQPKVSCILAGVAHILVSNYFEECNQTSHIYTYISSFNSATHTIYPRKFDQVKTATWENNNPDNNKSPLLNVST